MRKIRVLFPYVEAGFGHIMPMRSIEESFRKKYGDKVEIISSSFFTETGDKHMAKYEQMISRQVRVYNRAPVIGHFSTAACAAGGTKVSSLGAVRLCAPVAYKHALEHMRELEPDVVISTHWATNYYAEHLEKKPLTIMYCPDARQIKLFEYRSDLCMISMPYGYLKALRKKQYNINNMKLVPFFIRNEAFDIPMDKKEVRRKLGLPEDNFTILLAEGGYGIGKMAEVTEMLLREHLPLTVIPVCGTNKELYEKIKGYKCSDEVTYRPYAFADNMLELHAASDLFCGKSGNILAEATFFGNPSVVTHCATSIENNIADHYINTVGCAVKELFAKKAVDLICRFAQDPSLMEPYRRAALAYHENFGSAKAADVIWEKMQETFPELR